MYSKSILGLLSVLLAAGMMDCAVIKINQSPKTLPPGVIEGQTSVDTAIAYKFENVDSAGTPVVIETPAIPEPSLGARVGVADFMDIGIKWAWFGNLEADVKFNVFKPESPLGLSFFAGVQGVGYNVFWGPQGGFAFGYFLKDIIGFYVAFKAAYLFATFTDESTWGTQANILALVPGGGIEFMPMRAATVFVEFDYSISFAPGFDLKMSAPLLNFGVRLHPAWPKKIKRSTEEDEEDTFDEDLEEDVESDDPFVEEDVRA
jgi:hypothetical protein